MEMWEQKLTKTTAVRAGGESYARKALQAAPGDLLLRVGVDKA